MGLILGLLAGLVLCGFFVALMTWGVLVDKRQREAKVMTSLEADASKAEQSFDATVVDLQCRVVTVGIKSPRTVSEYLVYFKRADGTVCRYPVSEEFYSGFEIGQRGSVSVIDGAVYAFRLEDENIVE